MKIESVAPLSRVLCVRSCAAPFVLLVLLLLASSSPCFGADAGAVLTLTPENVERGDTDVTGTACAYRFGDDPAWAARDYDDAAWATSGFDRAVAGSTPSPDGERWDGAAWFRIHLNVDQRLASRPLAFRMEHWGASEIYIDGELVKRFGVIGAESDVEENPRWTPVPFVFAEGGRHVIALRYSYKAARDPSRGLGWWLVNSNFRPGFAGDIHFADYAAERQGKRGFDAGRGNRFFRGVLAGLALLHFLLYVFYRRERANLFYSLFAAGLAAAQMLSSYYQSGAIGGARSATGAGLSFVVWCVVFSIAMPSLLAFHYVAFEKHFPKRFRVVLLLWAAVPLLVGVFARRNVMLYFISAAFILTLIEAVRVMARALARRQPGAWIITTGLAIFTAGVFYSLAREIMGFRQTALADELTGYAILLAVPVSVSVYLARNFARTNLDLAAQLTQVQELSAREIEHERTTAELKLQNERERSENERRAQELEEARRLQLSMLPKGVPQIAGLEIAAYMKPASEVGGDYYDFHVGSDDTLTIVVGDATGHGLKAGTIVTATKSLFNAFAAEPEITTFFREASCALKGMNLRGLYMAMLMLKVRGSSVTLSAAGMPPVLIYRAGAGEVEEVLVKGMPLGSIAGYAYKEQEFCLSAGDCVVLMSDGFPERFDERGEMLGYERARAVLAGVAHGTAAEIVDRFVQTGDEWAGARAQDDDVTFVVLRVKDEARSIVYDERGLP